jgi:hypothetical protein
MLIGTSFMDNSLLPNQSKFKGRGKTAPYKTSHYRIPLPLKPIVEKLSNRYRELVSEYDNPDDTELINNVLRTIIPSTKRKLLSKDGKPTSCPKCKFNQFIKNGHQGKRQYYRCKGCGYRFTLE